MKKITYIFGAGASMGCLPLVVDIPKRILKQVEFLKKEEFILDETEFDTFPKNTKRSLQELLIQDLIWLNFQCDRHASIDTFAKKLWLTNKGQDLARLKRALSVFFIIEQFRFPPDSRYDTFYASILKKSISIFPDNITILSWNYDYQFEISFQEYSNDTRVIGNTGFAVDSKYFKNEVIENKFSLIKLNGTAAFVRDNLMYTYFNNFKSTCDFEIIEEIIRNYARGVNRLNRLQYALSFAWEYDIEEKPSIVDRAIFATKNTEILVVIGYSFPFFNREVDRQLINSMPKLEKVYIQAPNAIELAERFESVRDGIDPPIILPRKDVSQFLLPNEL